MTKADKQAMRDTIESIDLDLKAINKARRKAQAAIDDINAAKQAATIRLQNLEARIEKL